MILHRRKIKLIFHEPIQTESLQLMTAIVKEICVKGHRYRIEETSNEPGFSTHQRDFDWPIGVTKKSVLAYEN